MTVAYLPERAEHAAAIEAVLDRAFGPGRFAKTSERVRERGALAEPSLSRVAADEGVVFGVCRMWSVDVGGAPALLLGPLAVEPTAQHHGVGAQLVRECVAAARARGASAILTVGRAAFFEPLGFALIPEGRVTLPGPVDPKRFLWNLLAAVESQMRGPVTAPRGASPA